MEITAGRMAFKECGDRIAIYKTEKPPVQFRRAMVSIRVYCSKRFSPESRLAPGGEIRRIYCRLVYYGNSCKCSLRPEPKP